MIQAYKQCEKCSFRGGWEDKFCNQCGSKMQEIRPLPFVGDSQTRGIYRVTICIEREFDSEDEAEEAASRSYLNDEIRFCRCDPNSRKPGLKPIQVALVRSTVTLKTHPYVCRFCRDNEEEILEADLLGGPALLPPVSHTTEGRCNHCDMQDWVSR